MYQTDIRTRALIILVLVAGCTDAPWYVLPPPASGTTALLISNDQRPRLWVFAEWPVSPIRAELETPGATVVSAVVFEGEPPAALGLPEGAVELEAETPLTRGLPLGRTTARFFSSTEDGAWQESSEVATHFGRLHFRDPTICPSLVAEQIVVDLREASDGFDLATSLSEDLIIIATLGGEVFQVDAERRIQPVALTGLEGQLSALAAHRGALWAGTAEGEIYRGPPESPFELVRVLTSSAAAIDRLLITQVQEREEVLIIDRDRAVWHHDGVSWQRLHAFANDTTANSAKDLFEVAPGHVLASSLSEPNILRLRNGELEVETPEETPVSGFNRVTHVPEFGSMACGTFGELYSDESGKWAPLMKPTTSVNLGAMRSVAGGLLVATIFGGIELLYPDRRLACGPQTLPAALRTDFIGGLGSGFLLSGPSRETSRRAPVVFLQLAEIP